MFLYARIVLDNVEMLYDVEAIKNDLRALPKDLNEAWVGSSSRYFKEYGLYLVAMAESSVELVIYHLLLANKPRSFWAGSVVQRNLYPPKSLNRQY
jgi:hypothetical protein